MSDLSTSKYILFGTFRRDGTIVRTPTRVVAFKGGCAFTTDADSYKVKRLGRDPRVEVVPCDIRGRVRDGVALRTGIGRLPNEADAQRVESLVRRKYPIGWAILIAPSRLVASLRGRRGAGSVAVAFTLD